MPRLPALREPVNALTHWAGALVALLVLWPLLGWADRHDLPHWPFVVFCTSMALLYVASALYHSVQSSENGLLWLRKLDHAAIFVLIAGTDTPVIFFGLPDGQRNTVLYSIWGIALAGIALKLLTLRLPRWISTLLYLGMGWFTVIFLPQLVRNLPSQAIFWLAVGGVFYSVGAIVYAARWTPRPNLLGFHELWHLFVLAGTAAHVAMMFNLR